MTANNNNGMSANEIFKQRNIYAKVDFFDVGKWDPENDKSQYVQIYITSASSLCTWSLCRFSCRDQKLI